MGTIQDIKAIFIGLSSYQQEQLLDDLLQEHEIKRKVIEPSIKELSHDTGKKP